jgi:hypothetical protein
LEVCNARSPRILDRVENGRRNKMFPDVLVLSLAVGSAPRDKAMKILVLCPQACTRSFPYSQSSKAITSSPEFQTVALPNFGVATPLGFEPRITPPQAAVLRFHHGVSRFAILVRRFSFKAQSTNCYSSDCIGWRTRQMTVRKSSGTAYICGSLL